MAQMIALMRFDYHQCLGDMNLHPHFVHRTLPGAILTDLLEFELRIRFRGRGKLLGSHPHYALRPGIQSDLHHTRIMVSWLLLLKLGQLSGFAHL
jgi:hypothetical protein